MSMWAKIKAGAAVAAAGIITFLWAMLGRRTEQRDTARREASAQKSAREKEHAVREDQQEARREAQEHEAIKRKRRGRGDPVTGNAGDRLRDD